MAGSLPLKNDVQLVTQFPQSRRQALDVLSAAESVLPISNSEVRCGPTTRPATVQRHRRTRRTSAAAAATLNQDTVYTNMYVNEWPFNFWQ